MPNVLLNDKVQARFYCNQQNQQAINVINFRVKAVTGANQTDAAIADLLSTTFAPSYKDWMTGAQFYEGLRFQVMGPIKLPYVASVSGAGAGVGLGTNLPSQVAVDVRLKSATFGRRAQGRMYLPFWNTTFLTQPGYLANTGVTKAANLATILLGDINLVNAGGDITTLRAQIWSKKFNQFYDIDNAQVITAFATQRRRSNINRPDAIGP